MRSPDEHRIDALLELRRCLREAWAYAHVLSRLETERREVDRLIVARVMRALEPVDSEVRRLYPDARPIMEARDVQRP